MLSKNKPILAAAIGNFIEVYDYSHFIFFSPIIAQVFFPVGQKIALTFTFLIYAIERFVRPVAGVYIGKFVDRNGRCKTLYLSVVGMIITGLFMSILPGYKVAGFFAPILLLIVRLMQGMLISGEFVTSMVYIYEHAPKEKKGVLSSIVFFSGIIGCFFSSSLSFLIVFFCSEDFILSIGWRIPYLIGIVFLLVSYSMRKNMLETPSFIQNKFYTIKPSIKKLLNDNAKPLILCSSITAISAATYSIFVVYATVYLNTTKHLSLIYSAGLTSFNLIFYALLLPIMGYLADKVGSMKIILSALVGILIFTVFLYPKLTLAINIIDIETILLLNLVLIAALNGPLPAFISELFPANSRATSLSIGYGISLSIFGGITPIICTYLPVLTNNLNSPVFYITTLTIIALFFLIKLKNQPKYTDLATFEVSNDQIRS